MFKIEKHGFTETKKIDFKLDEQNFEKAGVMADSEHAHELSQKTRHSRQKHLSECGTKKKRLCF